ncbi:acetylornithine deacetylase [Spirochaetia bacterium]|nr:acetylornithine deacetylase [Spirochaetia bacterium]
MKEKIFSFINDSESIAVELETELTKIPAISPDSGGKGELSKCIFLENWLKTHGITELLRIDIPDERAQGGVRPNLIATLKGTDINLPSLWIMSHLDVVPVGEISLWKTEPWTVVKKDGKLFGRGTEDNQQGLTSSVIAALSLAGQNIAHKRTIKLLFVADEECGSYYGIDWILKNRREIFKDGDLVLIPDSGDEKGETIEIAEKNMLWVKFHITGKQSHASRPDLGNNASIAGARLAVLLNDELKLIFTKKDPLFYPDHSTIEVTKKEVNVDNINTIPGDDIFYMDMRILPMYKIKDILNEVDKIINEFAKKWTLEVKYSVIQQHESKSTPVSSPIVGLLSNAIKEVYNLTPKPIGIGGGTVGAYLRNAGIDCVAWSSFDEMAHQPNEYAKIENILGDAKVMALLMLS